MTDNSTQYVQSFWTIGKRQFAVASVVFLLLGLLVALLYWKDRQREWRLREEQANHRLELAYELIARDLGRVKSDILLVAAEPRVRDFDPTDDQSRRQCENAFSQFLIAKGTYQQIRLIDPNGVETIRVDLHDSGVHVVERAKLQNKKDRYYVRDSMTLGEGELFVSEFDLNQERGVVEKPLNPVIRFVTPIVDSSNDEMAQSPESKKETKFLLVANYRGAPLLRELGTISLPGFTYLVRNDGQFLLGAEPKDAWGWLLDHEHSLATRAPDAWNGRWTSQGFSMTPSGAFAFRPFNPSSSVDPPSPGRLQSNLLIVSHLPQNKVFESSNQTLYRLILLVAAAFVPILLLTRYWARASFRRELQNEFIRESEQKLRELSTRLVKIQEDERQAISREIHDQLGQQATAINLDLKMALREAGDTAKVRKQLERAIGVTEKLLEGLHEFATRIRPVELDDLGLVDALESHIWEFSNRTGIKVQFDENIQDRDLPSEVCENAFRLVQESLNNVLKHAKATQVEVAIKISDTQNGDGNDRLTIRVQDNGVGMAELPEVQNGKTNKDSRLGFLGMRERVDLLNGTVEIQSLAGKGTTVTAKIPVSKQESTEST